ncbi:MAG: hypothetical protein KDB57_06835 [Solirubrobacterales bacterium]|nr:hypothetical protein [Solirubrobacterales bacterium]
MTGVPALASRGELHDHGEYLLTRDIVMVVPPVGDRRHRAHQQLPRIAALLDEGKKSVEVGAGRFKVQ